MAKPKPSPRKAAPPGRPSQVRLIAGLWRGRKLPVADREGLRPTPDRVRETLFNWLAPWVPGSRCLDCFSGTGALALEALSRGAAQACLLEFDQGVAQQLRCNLATLNDQRGRVIQGDALLQLAQPAPERFDLVFLDPPFRRQMLARCCELLEANGWLAEEARIYVECEKELSLESLPSNWTLYREKSAGQVSYRLFQRQP
ncbi:16S rRNA (guanine(966)-N(2))-methyltransferase RsmD [Aestuariirhabdus litorea]|uniref:Ribosomal RNA small subunit methyltransferase D n=1 Tax=Aestuariirhabdus litorea TaxID=2528527 RepID=A0A3P3VJ25_9GAMM|nr:16S rRNA (guanine(966)-N(2))-methyltransferase RsmD [Aestuariirhabdus litorea]RRJ82682.1 16S rRNA (guanine(966)-N(2))-methyltransferase RsmD [Aestuariirhabdus litorea]RWW92842.1 16S rRNA (guanine(966)-N(2))-methyltransferase RsmD [Endozoicomonadaceae bacterium GTF-13]